MCGNPTRTSGYFYEAFHRMREVWKTHKVSCFDSSRCSADYTDAQALKYGVDSNVYRVRELGEFPKQDDDTVISLAQVEDASVRAIEPEGYELVRMPPEPQAAVAQREIHAEVLLRDGSADGAVLSHQQIAYDPLEGRA